MRSVGDNMLTRLVVVCCAIVATLLIAPPPYAAQEIQPVIQRPVVEVPAPATPTGRIRVIVGVRAPFVPEGDLGSFVAADAQRSGLLLAQNDVMMRMGSYSVSALHRFETIPYLAMEVDGAGLAALAAMPDVTSVTEDAQVFPTLAQSTAIIEATTARARGFTGLNTAVAIIDTGVEKTHPMFSGRIIAEACYASDGNCPGGVTSSTATGSGNPCTQGHCDHGTHVAGIAAGSTATLSGVAPQAGIIAIQVFTASGGAFFSDIIRALEYTLTLKNAGTPVAAANMSLGTSTLFTTACDASFSSVKAAIDNLRSVGVATVISSGNSSSSTGLGAPGCISSAVSVGSTTKSDGISSFSNSASMLNLLAPGSAIQSAIRGGAYASISGTSMAAPHVTGTWAVLKQQSPGASVASVLSALAATGKPILDSRNGLTRSRINVNAALDALDPSDRPAELTGPAPSSTLSATSVTFSWTSGTGVSEYYLYVGRSPGGFDIYEAAQGSGRSRTVTGIPLTGEAVYVRLYSKIAGVYQHRDYIYGTASPTPAVITSPSPGSAFASTSVTFSWSQGTSVSEYYLYVGTGFEGFDLYQGSQGTSQSRTVSGLPNDGRAIHVTLWSRINGAYQKRHYSFAAVDGRAAITSPSPGSVLSGSTVTFVWSTGVGVSDYYLYVGSSVGGYDLYEGNQGSSLSRELVGLPTDGRPVYVRLWSRIAGGYRVRDHVFTAASLAASPALVTFPTAGVTLSTGTATFSWSTGVGVTEYYLYVGSTPGGFDIYHGPQGTTRSRSVSGIPIDGRMVYVTLWSRIAGVYQTRHSSYRAATADFFLTFPGVGTKFSGTSALVTWSGLGVTQYYLYVGSTPGGHDLYEGSQGIATARTVTNLPTDGRVIWIRLWARIDGVYRIKDYRFIAAG